MFVGKDDRNNIGRFESEYIFDRHEDSGSLRSGVLVVHSAPADDEHRPTADKISCSDRVIKTDIHFNAKWSGVSVCPNKHNKQLAFNKYGNNDFIK